MGGNGTREELNCAIPPVHCGYSQWRGHAAWTKITDDLLAGKDSEMRKSNAAVRNGLLLAACIVVFLIGAAIIAANLG